MLEAEGRGVCGCRKPHATLGWNHLWRRIPSLNEDWLVRDFHIELEGSSKLGYGLNSAVVQDTIEVDMRSGVISPD